jgi:ABC-type Mn2+/Zn2+ transport system ATPase subunit
MTPVQFLASKFPGKTEQEYRSHLGNFQISGMTGLQMIGTLSGGQKSRVAFAVLSLQQPHILLLDEPTNHLDIEGLDALMIALQKWNGGVIIISHDERFITTVAKEVHVTPPFIYYTLTFNSFLFSCGFVATELSENSKAMYRVIRTSSLATSRQNHRCDNCDLNQVVIYPLFARYFFLPSL